MMKFDLFNKKPSNASMNECSAVFGNSKTNNSKPASGFDFYSKYSRYFAQSNYNI